jgi:hypothetical protein
MLAVATGRPVEAQTSSATGTSIGAALLARMKAHLANPAPMRGWMGDDKKLAKYVKRWREGLAK